MTEPPAACVRLADYLRQCIASGDDGLTVLVGFDGQRSVIALGVGLQGESDHDAFLTFARYVLHSRFDCDGWGLMLPALIADESVYLIELRHAGVDAICVVDPVASVRPWTRSDPLIGDLAAPAGVLPGIQRREMDRIVDAARLPLP